MATNKKREMLYAGVIIGVVGLYLLLTALKIGGAEKLWPVFILAPGLEFMGMYWRGQRREVGFVIPAVITIGISLLFLYINFTDITKLKTLWPLFLFIIGLSLFAAYVAGMRNRGIMLPAVILCGIGVIFLLIVKVEKVFIPLVILAFGVILVVLSILGNKEDNKEKLTVLPNPKAETGAESEDAEKPHDKEDK